MLNPLQSGNLLYARSECIIIRDYVKTVLFIYLQLLTNI